MKMNLGKRTISKYLLMASAAITIVTAIIYVVLTKPYGLFNKMVFAGLLLSVLTNVCVVAFRTRYDSYIQIVGVVFTGLSFSLFLEDSVGTINDWMNDVVFMGSGAPIENVFVLAGIMLVIACVNIIVCFTKKAENEPEK